MRWWAGFLSILSRIVPLRYFEWVTQESRTPHGDAVAPLPGLKKSRGQTILPSFQPDASKVPPERLPRRAVRVWGAQPHEIHPFHPL